MPLHCAYYADIFLTHTQDLRVLGHVLVSLDGRRESDRDDSFCTAYNNTALKPGMTVSNGEHIIHLHCEESC